MLEAVGAAHRRYPRLLAFQELLLEALAALGRAEREFDWARAIRIVRDKRGITPGTLRLLSEAFNTSPAS